MADIPSFTAREWLEIPRTMREYRGATFSFPHDALEVLVDLDRETHDFQHLLGQRIAVDGLLYTCFLVNRFAHTPPWRPGEPLGLIMAPEVQQAC